MSLIAESILLFFVTVTVMMGIAGLGLLIILLVPLIAAEAWRVAVMGEVKARFRNWQNRPRVKTGPMPITHHPYR